ncbi:MAG TPA: SRPBCC domain-containing protein [Gemmatimonadaceae bacterium]|nr:SRPBCC domain-containing protein [Gemmatimonadaceae bacterium]
MSDRASAHTAAPSSNVVRESVDIAAPADAVFRALVDPQELATWLGGSEPRDMREPTRDSELTPDDHPPAAGQSWRAPALAPDGTRGSVRGEYLVVEPPHRLESTWRASWNDFAPERVRFELVPIDVGGMAGTRVIVTHTRSLVRLHATASAATRASAIAVDLWPSVLARLAAHVAIAVTVARWSEPHDGSPEHWFDALHRAVVDIHHGA